MRHPRNRLKVERRTSSPNRQKFSIIGAQRAKESITEVKDSMRACICLKAFIFYSEERKP